MKILVYLWYYEPDFFVSKEFQTKILFSKRFINKNQRPSPITLFQFYLYLLFLYVPTVCLLQYVIKSLYFFLLYFYILYIYFFYATYFHSWQIFMYIYKFYMSIFSIYNYLQSLHLTRRWMLNFEVRKNTFSK